MWKVLNTSLDGSEKNAPSIVMDRDGHPFCAWVDGSAVKAARFRGGDWEYLGDKITVVHADNPKLSKNCLTMDEDWNPHMVISGSGELEHLSWNGIDWESEVVCDSENIIDWTICIFDKSPMIATLSSYDEYSTIRMYAMESGEWVLKDDMDMPQQVVEAPELIIKTVDRSIYAFWINRDVEGAWIAHVIYRTASSSWQGFWSRLVYHSEVDGDITGLDFVAADDEWSSSLSSASSSSYSSVSSSSYSSLSSISSSSQSSLSSSSLSSVSSSSRSSSSVSSASSHSSSSDSSTGCICPMFYCGVSPEYGTEPTGICKHLSNWSLTGLYRSITDGQCRVNVEVGDSAARYVVITDPNNGALALCSEVVPAIGPATITLSEDNASGVSGSVDWDGIEFMHPSDPTYAGLFCEPESESWSSDVSSSYSSDSSPSLSVSSVSIT